MKKLICLVLAVLLALSAVSAFAEVGGSRQKEFYTDQFRQPTDQAYQYRFQTENNRENHLLDWHYRVYCRGRCFDDTESDACRRHYADCRHTALMDQFPCLLWLW